MTLTAADRLLVAGELATRWQMSERTVLEKTRKGAIPVVKIGRLYRYRLDAIEEFERKGGMG